jgi:aminopeptidase YwaD
MNHLNQIAIERPIGTENNFRVVKYIEKFAIKSGLKSKAFTLDCYTWKKESSFIMNDSVKFEIYPSPFSLSINEDLETVLIENTKELKDKSIKNKLVILHGEIAKNPLMPKSFPLYFPEEHKLIYDLLESKQPKAVLCITDQHPICGLSPFPMFEDGSFNIPSAYISSKKTAHILPEKKLRILIQSKRQKNQSKQIIINQSIKNDTKKKIIICAHIDSKYETLGAIDNATGTCVLLELISLINNYNGKYNIEIVPFNGEEYYEISGQMVYLKYLEKNNADIKLVINIDAVAYKSSKIALSKYNLDENFNQIIDKEIESKKDIEIGEEWVAGDHSIFSFQGIPCIALTSSNLFTEVIPITHTMNDTSNLVNYQTVKKCAFFINNLINKIK